MNFMKQDPLLTGFRVARRKEVNVSRQELVRMSYIEAGGILPLVIQPAMNESRSL